MSKVNNEYPELDFIPRPDEVVTEDGYPTDEALEYIKNWAADMVLEPTPEDPSRRVMKFGKYFGDVSKKEELLSFIEEIWWMPDWGFVRHDKGHLELHTAGWSGNEAIIRELKETALWLMDWKRTEAGGHYYFNIGGGDIVSRHERAIAIDFAEWVIKNTDTNSKELDKLFDEDFIKDYTP